MWYVYMCVGCVVGDRMKMAPIKSCELPNLFDRGSVYAYAPAITFFLNYCRILPG